MGKNQDKQFKKVKLRAFEIHNNNIKSSKSDVFDRFSKKIEKSISCKDREMVLDHDDLTKERDLISSYVKSSNNSYIFCTMMRISNEINSGISKKLLSQKQFSVNELISIERNEKEALKALCKNYFYFAMNNRYFVTNLASNRIIKPVQTYLNYYLGDTSIELSPMIKNQDNIKFSEIDTINFCDPIRTINSVIENSVETHSIFNIKKIFDHLIQESSSLNEIDADQLVSIELKLMFKKPRGMSEYDYKKKLSAHIKPIADLDSIIYKTKSGDKFIKGKDIVETKLVDIEDLKFGRISEPDLNIEMGKYLHEINE